MASASGGLAAERTGASMHPCSVRSRLGWALTYRAAIPNRADTACRAAAKAANMRRFTLADHGVLTKVPNRVAAGGVLRERAWRTVLLLVASQLGVAIVAAAIAAAVYGMQTASSVLVGAIIGIVPNYCLAGRMFRRKPGATAQEALRHIYTGELVKIVFTAALFVIALELLDVDFLLVVLGYAAMVAVNWLALLVVDLGELPQPAPIRARVR